MKCEGMVWRCEESFCSGMEKLGVVSHRNGKVSFRWAEERHSWELHGLAMEKQSEERQRRRLAIL